MTMISYFIPYPCVAKLVNISVIASLTVKSTLSFRSGNNPGDLNKYSRSSQWDTPKVKNNR